MPTDENYHDLTALFEAQDEALQSDVFVEHVMQPVRKHSRWRAPLLFGAGGLGVGAALSQMGGLFEAVNVRAASLSQSIEQVRATPLDSFATEPLWLGAILVVIVSCVAIVATERA